MQRSGIPGGLHQEARQLGGAAGQPEASLAAALKDERFEATRKSIAG
jgi:hypothetical protein